MPSSVRLFSLSLLSGAMLLAGCGAPDAKKPATPAPPPAAKVVPPTPPVDAANARQFLTGDSTLVVIDFPRTGSLTMKGSVKGDAAPVYAVALASGQTLTVTFKPSNTNLYFNVSDAADHSGAALHRGEVDGGTATVKADRDMTLVIKPFQPRALARRGAVGDFTLTLSRT